ncbi:MAG: hypothetical protein FWE27_08390 [Defluviitaleaceae bacterium]|nr:hypothetical protein [Defluviitaleaceae bacterium]
MEGWPERQDSVNNIGEELKKILASEYSELLDSNTFSSEEDEETLADLILGDNANILYQSNIHTYHGRTNPYVDFKQLAIMRNSGKWSLMQPMGGGLWSHWEAKDILSFPESDAYLFPYDYRIVISLWGKRGHFNPCED